MDEKGVKLNVVARSSSKNVYYCSLDNEIVLSCMLRHKNLLIVYDSGHSLNFWREPS